MNLSYLISLAVYLLAPACLCLRHGFHVYDPDLSIHMCLSIFAIWLSHHHSPGSSDSSGSSCSGFGDWSVWILPVADQSGAAVAWISSRPSRTHPSRPSCSALEFSCYASEPPFILFILVHPCILAIAPYWWCNILVIFVTSGDNFVTVLMCWNV